MNRDSRVSQLTAPGFDAFLRDVLVPLGCGGTVCIPGSKEALLQPGELLKWLERSRVSVVHCVPSLFRLLASGPNPGPNPLPQLKFILLSGEKLNPPDLAAWYDRFDPGIHLVNLWGTSETTLAKTCYFIEKTDSRRPRVPVGKPLPGASTVVLDSDLRMPPDRRLLKGAPVLVFTAREVDQSWSRERSIFAPPFGQPATWMNRS